MIGEASTDIKKIWAKRELDDYNKIMSTLNIEIRSYKGGSASLASTLEPLLHKRQL